MTKHNRRPFGRRLFVRPVNRSHDLSVKLFQLFNVRVAGIAGAAGVGVSVGGKLVQIFFTDFFILDALPPEGIRRKMHLLHLHLLQGMMKKNVDYSRFSLKNRILLRATHLMGLPFSYAWKAHRYEKVSTRYREGNDLHMSNGAFELMTHVWHPDQFAEKIQMPFEDVNCLVPKRYDEVLTTLFGPDYMTPPPVEERVAKHLDL